MVIFADYVKVGHLSELNKTGWIKSSVAGKDIMILLSDYDPVAIEIGDEMEKYGIGALPIEFHPESSDILDYLLDRPEKAWGELKTYPVKIEGDNILIGLNLLE